MYHTAGEEAGVHGLASEPPQNTSISLDIDGITFSHGAAAETVSPVFSLWLTFVLMYIGKQPAPYPTLETERGSMDLIAHTWTLHTSECSRTHCRSRQCFTTDCAM